MYNEKYINDFDIEMYDDYLSNPNKLKELADSYVNQYTNPTYDCTIAFKESLDHYISKQIQENPLFMQTNLFNNYFNYIAKYIFEKRNNNGVQLEYNTNILFQNDKTKNIILSKYDDDTRNNIISIINENENNISLVFDKIDNGEVLNFDELNIISDYLYTRRDLSNVRYSKFIEYLLNNEIGYSATPQIAAAYISYLPKVYGDGCENSRAILSNGIARSNDIKTIIPSEIDKYRGMKKLRNYGFYSSGDKYISMGWSFISGVNLDSDLSLDHSRTMAGHGYYEDEEKKREASKYNDLYWISMVTFHEMTHQFQNKAMKSLEINSSGLSQLIKRLKNDDTDITINHDSIESEIEADEVAWDKMFNFIADYRLKSKNPNVNKKDVEIQLKKCIINKETGYARRSIQTKYQSDENFFAFDIKEIQSLLNDPKNGEKNRTFFKKMMDYYPMLGKVFDDKGRVKTTVMFDYFTSNNKTGNDEHILACELSDYILGEGYNALKKHLVNDNLSETQITNLMMNIYNTYHLEKKFINSLSKLDFSQLDETKTNFDYKDKNVLINKYFEKFKNVANLVYKERELINIIEKKYPNYNIEKKFEPEYAIWNYQDMFKHLWNISNGMIDENAMLEIINKYENTGDVILTWLAEATKNSLKELKADKIISAMEDGQIDTNGKPIYLDGQQVISSRQMGFAKVWVLGIITALISIGIILLGVLIK